MSALIQESLQDNPIAITGTGVMSACGADIHQFWKNIMEGNSAASWLKETDSNERWAVCQIPSPWVHQDLGRARRMDRTTQLALIAARQAWSDARLPDVFDLERVGIAVGSSRGPVGKWVESIQENNSKKFLPSLAVDTIFSSTTGLLAQEFGAKGPCFTLSSSCASGASALMFGVEQLLLGKVDCVLAGATEASIYPVVMRQLDAAGLLGFHDDPKKTCRPFDRTRNGILMGEAAVFFILERSSSAKRRAVKPYAFFRGWAVQADAKHRAALREDGSSLLRVMEHALNLSQLEKEDVGYIHLHGTGTRNNDSSEAQALRLFFGNHLEKLFCSSTKPITGHTLGASAALGALVSILALKYQQLPPQLNCFEPDSECLLPFAPKKPSKFVRTVMSNASGFWGNHSSLVFSLDPPSS